MSREVGAPGFEPGTFWSQTRLWGLENARPARRSPRFVLNRPLTCAPSLRHPRVLRTHFVRHLSDFSRHAVWSGPEAWARVAIRTNVGRILAMLRFPELHRLGDCAIGALRVGLLVDTLHRRSVLPAAGVGDVLHREMLPCGRPAAPVCVP